MSVQKASHRSQWCAYPIIVIGLLVVVKTALAQTVNGTQMDNYFRDVCGRVLQFNQSSSNASAAFVKALATPQGQSDLRGVCGDVIFSEATLPNDTLDRMNAGSFEAFKLDALLFAQSENDSVMDRLQALRRGKRSGQQTALDVNLDGNLLLGATQPLLRGGGASADEAGGLLGSPWGGWLHVNAAKGDKDPTALTGPLDLKQTGVALGSDYRLSDKAVVGVSLGFRDAKAKFGPGGNDGGMDSKTWTFSTYGSLFVYRDLYVDAVVNYGKIDYDTRRNIFDSSGVLPTRTARGSPNGRTLSGGASVGYDFAAGGLTLTPALGYFYVGSKTDAFEEQGADGLDLAYGEQRFHSSTARVELNASYAINSSAGVWQPYVRTQWVREFADSIDMFDVRFVNDIDPSASPLKVLLDPLDRRYWRINAGLSAQFPHDIAAYLDYQQLLGFNVVSFHNFTLGMRMQF